MLNNIYCDPDEKDIRYMLILFNFHVHKFWKCEKKIKIVTANAALKTFGSNDGHLWSKAVKIINLTLHSCNVLVSLICL